MRLSSTGLALIKQCEGFRATTYLDSAGLPTIGYGHRLLPGEQFPAGIDEAAAAAILANDVRSAEEAVTRLVKVPLTQCQFDALVDFAYNLGPSRLAASTLLKELNAGRIESAAAEFLKWDRCAGRELSGLKARREAERSLFLSAASSSEATA
jgi:lysozyme